jgi:abequosyltransferase
MTLPRLSICIATYNRADVIGETLESIIPQVTEDVEIVIVDGASTDDTGVVIGRYSEHCPQIRYIRLPEKGGVDQDYCRAVEHARGEMCWLFTDDDLFDSGAVKAVLDEIEKGYSLIVVNAQVMSKDFSKVFVDKQMPINGNEIYDRNGNDKLFQRVIPFMSFIGCVVINRDLWLRREKERYYGTEFIHVGVIFQEPLPGLALVIAESYIKIRFGNAQWTSRAFEIWVIKWPNLLRSFENISERQRQEYGKTESWHNFKTIVIYRALGAYSAREYVRWFSAGDFSLWWRLGALFIVMIPSLLMNSILLIYYMMLKIGESMIRDDLWNSKHNVVRLMRMKFR